MGVWLVMASCGGDAKKDYPKVQIDSVALGTALPVGSSAGKASCCVAIRFDYVRACGNDEAMPRKMNTALLGELLGAGYGRSGVRQALDSFSLDYKKRYRQEMDQLRAFSAEYSTPMPEEQAYSIELDNRLVYNDCGIATFRCIQHESAAGAEAETRVRFLNFDVPTGRLLTLDDLFVEGYEERIDALLLQKMLELNKVKTVQELEELGYFTSSSLYPSTNFCIEGRKLLFVYNPDDGIGPYDADVATVVPVELDDLSLIFSANSPLRRVVE